MISRLSSGLLNPYSYDILFKEVSRSWKVLTKEAPKEYKLLSPQIETFRGFEVYNAARFSSFAFRSSRRCIN